ncbi:hypothetical protein FCJ30_01600 [Salmonella enterica]|uniref:Uncharacterized protein n=2 Tax=Salmonella enterica I TaxID=59201 RepID=A0A3V2Y5J5_SALNE|nr:hypothetical protein [Salmonella enterica]EBW9774976.1 hypothetical protein [Salmonella enterica subsp. enterica serovar Bovismorbificans]ECH8274397.1 hypothetical protein [Salmonella enterica subsp. enterica]EEH1861491.1 hypothetical protein [Salmonella enterica subsp. houtenae serovar 50:g,z51:-]EAA7395802.1 hypothetical protein [Salmonella enterica subsp. enterica serovar Newport]EAC1115724.1 hypothetical protein [Salmonella enterica subsp. enterica serovar Java]
MPGSLYAGRERLQFATELDGGSFTTIREALQQWCKLKAEEQHLQDVMWKTATTEAEMRIQAERQTLNDLPRLPAAELYGWQKLPLLYS